MLCYVDVGQTLFFQDTSGRIPRSDGKEARVGRSETSHMEGVETTHFRCRWLSRFPRMAPVDITKLRDMLCCCVLRYAFPAMLRSAHGRRHGGRAYVAHCAKWVG